MCNKLDDSTLARWRLARRLTLGAIVVAGSLATAMAITHRLAGTPCGHGDSARELEFQSYYSYSGIGVEMAVDGEDFVVRSVFAGAPAEGRLVPGTVLTSVDGVRPDHMQAWSTLIRGEAGTEVVLEVVQPDATAETIVLQRDVIRVRY